MDKKNYSEVSDKKMVTVNNSPIQKVKSKLLKVYNGTHKKINKAIKKHGSKKFKRDLLDKKLPKAYKLASKAPVDENKVVFIEVRHPYVTNSFSVIFDELVNHYDYTIHTHFLLNNNTPRADYAKRCVNAIEDIATAKYVFVDEASNALSSVKLRPETKMVQLWHGCGAFKKFGFSTADLIFGDSRKEQLRHPYYKNYSLVTVSSPEVIWAYSEAMNIPEDSGIIKAIGSSRTDIFFDEEFIKESYKHLYQVYPQAQGKKVILYAPTFRGRVAKAQTPKMLNVGMFYENLGDEYILLFKHHPLVKNPPTIEAEYEGFAANVGNRLTTEELLCVADICISDYSSLVFEYSLFEKPLIFFAYDLDEYFDWRGFYYDYYDLAPGLIAKTNFEMIDYIKNIDTRFDKKAIQDFRYKFMRSCDGHSTQRILEYTFDDLEKHRKPCENFEHFYTVPKVDSSVNPYFKRIKAIEQQKDAATQLYAKASKEKITQGSIVALDIGSNVITYFLEKYGHNNIQLIRSGESFDEVISSIAAAQYILIDQPSILLDSLTLRPETKVIYLPLNGYPLRIFGKLTKSYRSGLMKEQYELAPLLISVTAITASSEETGELLKTSIGNDIETLNIGDLKTDALFDADFKNAVYEKLYGTYPQLAGRKIIAYVSRSKKKVADSLLYEYLHNDYVIIKCHINAKKAVKTSVYYNDTIVDVSKLLGVYSVLAVADIAIGDFSTAVYTFMATSKPLFIYHPDSRNALLTTESFVDIKEASPTPIYEDIMDIINVILDIDNYDYTKYNELKEKYLKYCDGNSTIRLLSSLN